MSALKNIIVLIAVFSATISTAGEKSRIYPIYSLENVASYEVSQDSGTLFIFEKNEAGVLFSGRDIVSGEIALSVQLEMPEAYFINTVIVDDDIYVFHVRILDREKEVVETSIFRVDSKNGQLENIYRSDERGGFAERFCATQNGLLITEKRGNSPFLFSTETNKMTAIELDEDYRIRSFDREKNCAVIIKQSNFNTNSKSNDEKTTYTEGDGSLLDVFICDFSAGFKLVKIGQYQPSYVLSKNEEETSRPHFIVEDSQYNWVAPSFMRNRFPIFPGSLLGDPTLYAAYESLVDYESIMNISFVGEKYALADQYLDNGERSLVVFNLQNPELKKTETVSETDQERIKSLFRGMTTTEKSLLDPAVLSQVFDPKYYKIDLVTTEVDSSDGQMSSFSSTETFIAVARGDVYSVLKKNEELAADVSGDFILNEKSALLFQDALDVLFPVGHFAEKHKAFYKNDDHWVFVRDESFGEKTGIIVKVDGDGKIVAVGPDENFAE